MNIQQQWDSKEILSLMHFTNGEQNLTDALILWCQENPHRTFRAARTMWYIQRRIQLGNPYTKKTETQKQEKKMNITHPQGALAFKAWTRTDEINLAKYRKEGKTWDEIGELMFRTRNSVQCKASRMDIAARKVTTKKTFKPLQEWIDEHPEMMKVQQQKPIKEETIPASIPIATLFEGREIKLNILSLKIVDNQLVIQF